MKNTGILIRNELNKQLRNKAFWFSSLGIPSLMAIILYAAHTFFSTGDASQVNMISGMSLYDKRIIMAVLFWFIICFGLLLNIIRASQNLFEEKNSRILEVLFTSVKPAEFITARVLSSIIAGSIQYLSSVLIVVIIFLITDSGKELSIFNPGEIVLWITVFFLFFELGMLFYISLSFLSIVIFKNIHSIQSGQMLIALMVILPTFFILNILNNPNTALVDMFIYSPFSSAFIYPTKVILTQFQFWEFIIAVVIIIGASLLILKLISKIIRRVILVK
jgi:ABC-2 type transport system permease protein